MWEHLVLRHGPGARPGRVAALFLGKHDRQLDDKGRLAIPAEYVRQIGSPDGPRQVVLAPGGGGCLWVVTKADWDARALELAARFGSQIQDEFFHFCQPREIDKAGRILIDERARQLAELPDPATGGPVPVVVAGSGRYIQVWRKDKYDSRASTPARFAEALRP